MKQIFNIILFVFINFVDISLSAKKSSKPVKTQDDALTWFNKYGYNPCLNSGVQCSLSFKSILEEYQERFHLKKTGKLDEATKQQMSRSRCGVKDKSVAELNSAAQLQQYKWSRTSLTYSLRGYPTQISQTNTAAIIREAFNAWLDYVPLKIEPACSTCEADFVIEFKREQHSDNYAFDGVGGTLAHAFFPEDGRVHFDKDEKWTERFNNDETNLYLVAVHEIGHALGLDHTYNEKSIMYPSYQPMAKSNILPQSDRDSIQKLYGNKQSSYGTPATTRYTTTTRSTTTTTTRRSITTTRSSGTVPTGKSFPRCRLFLDAAFKHPDGTLHTFKAGVMWRYSPTENRWDSRASSFNSAYPRLSTRLGAGLYDSQRKQAVFFTDTSYYTYDIDHQNVAKYRDEERLPKNLQRSIRGALYYDNKIHVITSKTIRSFNLDSGFQVSNERALSDKFQGLTGSITTAFSYGDLHHFFTDDRLVYVWSERRNTWQTFAKPMETNWFACSGSETSITQDIEDKNPPKHRNSHDHEHRHRHHHHHHHHD